MRALKRSAHTTDKWFGDSRGNTGEPEPPTPAMVALSADLQDVQRTFVQY